MDVETLTWEPTFVLERELSRAAYAFAEYGGDYPQRWRFEADCSFRRGVQDWVEKPGRLSLWLRTLAGDARSILRRWLFLSDRPVVGKGVTMKILLFIALLFAPSTFLRADDDSGEAEHPAPLWRTRQSTHFPAASCTTQDIPTPGFKEYWKLTLTFDQQSATQAAKLQPDHFYDMFRSQGLEDGSSTLILPLWGDFLLKFDSPGYVAETQVTAPIYETRPHEITISVVSNAPLTVEFLFTEDSKDFNLVRRSPSAEWMIKYLESFYRLGTNRPDGFSKGK